MTLGQLLFNIPVQVVVTGRACMFLVLHPSPSKFEVEPHGWQAVLTGYTTSDFIERAVPDNGLKRSDETQCRVVL